MVVTKGGDEETGAARVTADEWILQDMRRQQVHAHAHVCTACIGAGHAPASMHMNMCMHKCMCTCIYACTCHVFGDMHACASRRAAVSERIEVVTADKELRRKASDVHKNVKLINPVKWCATPALWMHCRCTLRMRCLARSSVARARARAPMHPTACEPHAYRLDPRAQVDSEVHSIDPEWPNGRAPWHPLCAHSRRWRRYLPRLKGLKSDYSNAPATDDE